MGSDPVLISQSKNPVIFFDGVCNLCNGSVQFIIRNDKKGYFHFASLQSEEAEKILSKHDIKASESNTILLLKDGQILTKSDAALEIARDLDGGWKTLKVLKILPRSLRNWVYDLLARNRYTWFGRQDQCMIPDPSLTGRFLHT